jgi:RNA polymerase sigma-70 factor, ECF subfamily
MQSGPTPNGSNGHADRLQRNQETLLVLSARAGDDGAFGQLIARFEKPLLYYLRRFIAQPEAVLDVHQEVWLAAYRQLPRLVSPEAFRAWLYRIAHDKAARFVRRAIRDEQRTGFLDENCAEFAAEAPKITEAEAVHKALDQLDVSFREALTLHYLRDLTLEEMALVLGCPVGTVKSRLFHARLALRQRMERNGYERDS